MILRTYYFYAGCCSKDEEHGHNYFWCLKSHRSWFADPEKVMAKCIEAAKARFKELGCPNAPVEVWAFYSV